MLINISITLITFLLMECVAWFTHKFIMHGFLWSLHKDHHVKENNPSQLEKNDSFFLIFAIPAMILFLLWKIYHLSTVFYIALGISIYGLAYFLIHDVFIHQRIKIFRRSDNRYLKAIRKAHKVHHKHLTKEEGECFGMLVVPWKYLREFISKKNIHIQ